MNVVMPESSWCRICGTENPRPSVGAGKCSQCGAELQAEASDQPGASAPLHQSLRSEQILTGNVALAWFATAVVGALAISLLRDVESRSLRLLAPCVVMVGYFTWAWNQPTKNQEKLADSLYFLGFIWTLYALIDTLIVSGVAKISADRLFVNFGYALVTTGLGMFLRMLVIQLEYSAPDQTTDARNSVARGLEDFRAELTQVIEALTASRGIINITTQEWSGTMTRTATEVSSSFGSASRAAQTEVAAVTVAVSAAGRTLQDVSRSAASLARRVGAASDKLGEAVSESVDNASASMNEAARALTEAARKLAALELPENTLSAHLERLAQELIAPSKQVISSMQEMAHSAVASNQEAQASSTATVATLQAVGNAVTSLSTQVNLLSSASESASLALKSVTASSTDQAQMSVVVASQQRVVAQSSVELATRIAELTRETSRTAEGMREPAAQFIKLSEEIASAATEAGRSLVTSASGAAAELGRASHSVKELGATMGALKSHSQGAGNALVDLSHQTEAWAGSTTALVTNQALLRDSLARLAAEVASMAAQVEALREGSDERGRTPWRFWRR